MCQIHHCKIKSLWYPLKSWLIIFFVTLGLPCSVFYPCFFLSFLMSESSRQSRQVTLATYRIWILDINQYHSHFCIHKVCSNPILLSIHSHFHRRESQRFKLCAHPPPCCPHFHYHSCFHFHSHFPFHFNFHSHFFTFAGAPRAQSGRNKVKRGHHEGRGEQRGSSDWAVCCYEQEVRHV